MKSFYLCGIVFFLLFVSCLDGNMPAINGMWQLKTIEDSDKTVQIDTIYFSFQRQAIFSYTVLDEKKNMPSTAEVIYGYIDFPDDKQLYIQIDKNQIKKDSCLLEKLLWGKEEITYKIQTLNSKRLILKLEDEGKTYNFIKF